MASVKMVGAQPIANHSFTLTCEATGDVGHIIWMHGMSNVYPSSTRNLSMDNATLTFDPVMLSDNGDYRCVASNSLSSFTSDIFTLDVFCECCACYANANCASVLSRLNVLPVLSLRVILSCYPCV